MKNSTPIQNDNPPYLVASLGRVIRVSGSFTELTGYSKEEVTDAAIEDILSMLRLTHNAACQLDIGGLTECWLFTKALEPRAVIISRQADESDDDGLDVIYTFCEKPHSGLEEVLSYPCLLLEENVIGVSIYSAPDFTLLKANQKYLELCDAPFRNPDRTIGRTIDALVDGCTEAAFRKSLTTGKSDIIKGRRFDQLITPVEADGRIKYIVTNTLGETEQVADRQQNKWLAEVYENMPFPLVALHKDGAGTTANRVARALFQGGGNSGTQFYDAADKPIDPNDTPCHKVRWGERAADFMMAVKKGEDTSYLNVSGTPVYDADGEFVAGLISYRDVTEQASYAKHHKSLIDAMHSGVIQYDSEGRVIAVNPAAVNILGMMPEITIGMLITEQLRTIKPDGSDFASEEYPVNRALRTGKPVQNTKMGFFNAVKEEFRWLSINAVPLFHPNDTAPYQVFAVFDDITEQKKVEDALKKSEASLRSVLDHSGDFIYSLNTQTNTYEYVSPSAVTVLGCSIETFMATDVKSFHESVHPEDRPVFEAALRALEEENETEIRFRQRIKSGEYRWFSNHLTDVRDEDGRTLYRNGRIRDITELVENDEIIRYQAGLLQSISDIIISSDENDHIKSWNKAAELTFGWTEEEAIGQNIVTLLKTQFIGQSIEEAYNKLLQYGKVEIETIDTCKDGRKLNMSCSPKIMKDANGKMTGIIGIFRDVTEKKRMEGALREKETHLRLAAEGAKLGTYAIDFAKQSAYFSEELKALWGLQPGAPVEFDSILFFKGLHPDDKQQFQEKIFEANDPNSDGLIEHDYRIIQPDSTVRWLHMRGMTTFDDVDGVCEPVYAAGVVIDITERVAAEQSLREISEELQNIIDSTDDYIYSIDSEFRLLYYNSAFEAYAADSLGKKLVTGIKMPEVLTVLEEPFWRVFYQRVAREGRIQLEIGIDEGSRVLSIAFNPVFVNGQMVEMTIFGRDVTERVAAENSIREISEELRIIMESTEDYIYSIDRDRRLLFFNSAFSSDVLRIFGEKLEKGMRISDVMTRLDDAYWEGFFERVANEGKVYLESRIDSGTRVMQFSFNPVYIDGQLMEMTVFGRDITKRVAVENSFREISEELQNIIDSTDDYIGSVDREYRLILFNSAFGSFMKNRFGRQIKKGERLADMLSPEFAPVWTELLERAATEGKYQIELSLEEGSRVMSFSFNPVYDGGQLMEITVFGKDITERLNSEREIIQLNTTLERRVQERTEELQKSVSDLKNLSRIISHDLKGPIRQIGFYAEHIQALTENSAIRMEAADIKITCGKMTRLIDGLSEFAMSSERKIRKEAVNVKKMATAIYNELKAAATNGSRLRFESGLPIVCADSVLLRHVLYNLLSNAMKFSSKREISEITLGCAEENGQYIFSIRDNGIGFDMQYAHKLFNVFERLHTEEEFSGSGMGLAAVRNIIERHGGRTWIESRENVGTTVYFTLPTS